MSIVASGTSCGTSQMILQVTRNTQTLSDWRSKKYHPEGWAQVGSEYTYGKMHVHLTYKVYIR